MNLRRAGTVLLAAGGCLVALAVFLPPGHERALWRTAHRALDFLLRPDPDVPITWREMTRLWIEVLGISYSFAAGLVILLSAFWRSRAAGWVYFLLHVLALASLAFLAMAAAAPNPGWSLRDSGSFRNGAAAALLGAVLAGELFWSGERLRPAARGPIESAGRWALADRINLIPASLFLLLQSVLFFVYVRHPVWPVMGHASGAIGSAAALAGMCLHAERKRTVTAGDGPPGSAPPARRSGGNPAPDGSGKSARPPGHR